MNMPRSGIRGFFEILMPGIFLLINLFFFLFLITPADPNSDLHKLTSGLLANSTYSIAILLSFG
jgi:hypothetical protein